MRERRLAALLVDMEVIAEQLDHLAEPGVRIAFLHAMSKLLQEADALICADLEEHADLSTNVHDSRGAAIMP